MDGVGPVRDKVNPPPPRGVCGTESEETCKVFRDGRLTLQLPTASSAETSSVCRDGGRVYFLDAFKDPHAKMGEKITDLLALSDAGASELMERSVAGLRAIVRSAGCSAVTLTEAKGGEMLGAYVDPKAVAIVHIGHGDPQTGNPISADDKALTPDSIDAERASKRLLAVESLVCSGANAAPGFQAKFGPGLRYAGAPSIINTGQAQARAEGEVAERLRKTLGEKPITR